MSLTMNSRPASPMALYRIILAAVGSQEKSLRRCLGFGVLTAVLRGAALVIFIPVFTGLAAGQWPRIFVYAGVMSLLVILSSITEWLSRTFDFSGHAARAGDELRRELGEQLRRIPLEALSRQRSGQLNAAIAGSVDDVVNFTLTTALLVINAVVIPLVTGLGAFCFNFRLGLAFLLLFPAITPVFLWARPRVNRHKRALHEANATLYAETVEYTQGLPELKAAGCVGAKARRFARAAEKVEETQAAALKNEARLKLLFASMVEIGMVLIIGAGLWLVGTGALQTMILAGFLVAVVRFLEPLSAFISMMSVFEMVETGYGRLVKLQAIKPLPYLRPVSEPRDFSLVFEGVTFAYAGQNKPALRDVNLTIPEKSLTAFVGPSGSGKTTAARMIMRYADPQKGRVTIGGIDIRQIDPTVLNGLIAVVFQDVYLFDDTIMANIRMGRVNATDAQVFAAARAAQCHEFIEQLPKGYNTRVGEIGNHLSGGEKQRISIARALLKDAPVIILDEPTAALDTLSERFVQKAIDALVKDKTVIVIAHRLTTIAGAQQIAVLDNGQLAEYAGHETLLAENGRYARLWHAQNGQSQPQADLDIQPGTAINH